MMLTASNGHTSQSLEDKLYALKYFISGQGIPFVIVKATTSELIGPKKKHLNYLITMSNEPNLSIPSMVKHLIMRAKHPEWSIAFKSLITLHQLITYGHEHLIQNIASSVVNSKAIESLCSFSDQTTTLAYNMSIFTRRYARYLSAKIHSYRMLGVDFCRTRPLVRMRDVSPEQLLQTIPIIQNQFDTLLAFDASLGDLSNGIINTAFSMLYKDFVKLYIVYQVAIIRLLEQYFASSDLKRVREMFAIYKKFLVRMDKVSDFMPVIDSVGMDKRDMPNLSRVPNLPLAMLERHLEQLEQANKRNTSSTTTHNEYSSMGRIDYGTLGRPRRRSIKTPARQMSIDILSPTAAKNYKRRNGELKHLDKMMMSFDLNRVGRRRSSRENQAMPTTSSIGVVVNGPKAQSSSVIVECDSEPTMKPNEYEELDAFSSEQLEGNHQSGSSSSGSGSSGSSGSGSSSITDKLVPIEEAEPQTNLLLDYTIDLISLRNEAVAKTTTVENFPNFDKLTNSGVHILNQATLNPSDASQSSLTTGSLQTSTTATDNLDPYAMPVDNQGDDSDPFTCWVRI